MLTRPLAWAAVAFALTACSLEPLPPVVGDYPKLAVTAEHKQLILERVVREPYAGILEAIRERAAREYEEPYAEVWDHKAIGHNNDTAQANALLAWLLDDEEAAAKARTFLLRMPTDFESNLTWDVNIRMPHVLMSYCFAWDLLRGAGQLSEAQAAEARARVTSVNGKFFDEYVDTDGMRQLALGVSQNNHPIRTASAIGMVAITFADHPEASKWANWAISELSYLMGPDGKYLQPDGGVSEGPFYYGFAYGPAVAMFIAMDNAVAADRLFERDCRNRQDVSPWQGHGCVDGERFSFDNPLHGELLKATVDWSINLRLPTGWRPPLADANFIHHNGGVLLTSFGGEPHHRWDYDNAPDWGTATMTWGMDLLAHHLAYMDDSLEASPPPWRNRFMPAAGNAVFRSGWQQDARWLLLLGENGPARKTLHDHVDGTSFSMAAYGEYLLLDPGYYKPTGTDNAITAHGDSHNVILIDGQGAPDKGLLTDFGDADAFIDNAVDGDRLAYAEARQSYGASEITRGIAFVRRRYFVVADRITTTAEAPREHAWRLGGWAGYDIGGLFTVHDCSGDGPCGARWQRELAGVDVQLASTAAGLRVQQPAHEPLTAPHVGAFDRQRTVADHGVIDGVVDALAPGYLAVLAPYRVGATDDHGPLTVSRLYAGIDATAWRVEAEGGHEVVWLRGKGAPATVALPGGAVLKTDAELVVVDAAGAYGLIARGSYLSLDGANIVSASGGEAVAIEE